MILKQGHTYLPMPHDGKVIRRISRGGRCYYIASPYSPEATQALKAAFPQYWTAIRDYGYAHPALVPFVNEDPMLIVSLVEVGKTRWLVGDGKAYIKTTFSAADYAESYGYRMKYKFMDSINQSFIGAVDGTSGPAFGQLFKSGNQTQIWGQYNWQMINFSRENITGNEYEDHITFDIKNNSANRRYLGQDHIASANMSKVTQAPAYIFAYNNGGVGTQTTKGDLAVCELYGNGETKHLFIPYNNGTECGMLDIVSLTFHPNANTEGSFTIAITDKE